MSTHTIGEVLNRLKGEFDDVTISKIRFLESEGLISPDRTESGYRKFTEADIDRLRYVLRAQRDRYLPLKVIKDELAHLDAGNAPSLDGDAAVADASIAAAAGTGVDALPPAAPLLAPPAAEAVLSLRELADAGGVDDPTLAALREHGLVGGGPTYDGEDLRVVRLAAQLLSLGLEARHLRMYLQFADREAALAEQLVAPLLRQRNPDSRATAIASVEQLAELGGQLHRALLGGRLRALLRP